MHYINRHCLSIYLSIFNVIFLCLNAWAVTKLLVSFPYFRFHKSCWSKFPKLLLLLFPCVSCVVVVIKLYLVSSSFALATQETVCSCAHRVRDWSINNDVCCRARIYSISDISRPGTDFFIHSVHRGHPQRLST